jgi:hypothetical protein
MVVGEGGDVETEVGLKVGEGEGEGVVTGFEAHAAPIKARPNMPSIQPKVGQEMYVWESSRHFVELMFNQHNFIE